MLFGFPKSFLFVISIGRILFAYSIGRVNWSRNVLFSPDEWKEINSSMHSLSFWQRSPPAPIWSPRPQIFFVPHSGFTGRLAAKPYSKKQQSVALDFDSDLAFWANIHGGWIWGFSTTCCIYRWHCIKQFKAKKIALLPLAGNFFCI